MGARSVESGANVHALEDAAQCLDALFREIFAHDGYGHLEVSIRFLKRGQKEILIKCGKEYRFVTDYPVASRECAANNRG